MDGEVERACWSAGPGGLWERSVFLLRDVGVVAEVVILAATATRYCRQIDGLAKGLIAHRRNEHDPPPGVPTGGDGDEEEAADEGDRTCAPQRTRPSVSLLFGPTCPCSAENDRGELDPLWGVSAAVRGGRGRVTQRSDTSCRAAVMNWRRVRSRAIIELRVIARVSPMSRI